MFVGLCRDSSVFGWWVYEVPVFFFSGWWRRFRIAPPGFRVRV